MKEITQVLALKRRLSRQSKRLDLSYVCELVIQDYSPEFTQDELGTLFTYPETLEIKIENWENCFYSFRVKDSRWIREGSRLDGVGLTTAQVYRRMLKMLKAHAVSIAEHKAGKAAV